MVRGAVSAETLARMWADRLGLKATEPEQTIRTPYNSLTEFKRVMYSQYQHAPHLALLDDYLERVSQYVESGGAEGIGRLIIAMPPRHGKTLTTSRYFPAWHVGRNPRHRVMLVSYGQSLANKNSRVARNLVKSRRYGEIFSTRLAEDSQSVMEWDTAGSDGEGGASALGIGGAATGKGAHVLIIDDPIKSRAEAESITYRNKIYDSYTDDLLTRLEPGGAVIVMATRWHEDDLTGRLLANERHKWAVLEMPALSLGEGDPLGRAEGVALWSMRYPADVLAEMRDALGDYSFSALYQQTPKPAEGNILKKAWFEPAVHVVPETTTAVRYWDLALSEKESADYTVGLRLELGADGQHYVTDCTIARVELANLPRFIKGVIQADGVGVVQGFEMAGYTTRAVTALAKDRELSQHVIKGFKAESDKLTRILPFAARASLGVIGIKRADWNQQFLETLASFPNGAHDDIVDACAGAWQMINDPRIIGGGRRVKERKYA